MQMKIVATIEARMTSSRLPGKVLLPVLGRPMLDHLLERLRAVPSIDEIVVATTTNATDDVLAAFAESAGVRVFRGSEDDVMTRVIGAADSASADVVVEITGDCPIIDPEIVEQTIQMFLHHDADYVSNADVRSYPDGMDAQVFRLDTLKRSAAMTNDELDHEHVTLHIRNHPELFRKVHLVAPPSLWWPELGLTLDEGADYRLLSRIIETLAPGNPCFGCGETLKLLRQNPDWVEINQAVIRKGDT
jgi:spore coat polysaccharide biosynthesis protein SpsF